MHCNPVSFKSQLNTNIHLSQINGLLLYKNVVLYNQDWKKEELMINVLANILTPQKAQVGSPIGIESYGEARRDRATVQNPGSVDGNGDATINRHVENHAAKKPGQSNPAGTKKKTVSQDRDWNTSAGAGLKDGILEIFRKSICSIEKSTPFSKVCNQ